MLIKKDVIYIDSNENSRADRFESFLNSKEIKENHLKVTGSNKHLYYNGTIRKRLPIGDFMKDGIFFEFKRDDDLENSIKSQDKRLDKQIDNYHVNYHNYEYHVIADNKELIDFDTANYFSDQRDVLFDQFSTETECFKYMLNCWANAQKTSRNHTLNKRYKANGFQQIGAMCVGHNLLTKISNYFPYTKARDWLELDETQLMEVPGIGNTKAKQILRKVKAYV